MARRIQSESGNMLVAALIGMAIVSLTGVVFASMMDHFRREQLSLSQKLEIMQLQQTMLGDLSNGAICACHFDASKVFDSNNLSSAQINLGGIYSGCNAGVPDKPVVLSNQAIPGTQSKLAASSVRLTNIQATGGSFRGDIEVNFNTNSLVVSRRPATIPIFFQADLTNTSAAKITGCSAIGAGSSAGGSAGASCNAWPIVTSTAGGKQPPPPSGVTLPVPSGNWVTMATSCGFESFACINGGWAKGASYCDMGAPSSSG